MKFSKQTLRWMAGLSWIGMGIFLLGIGVSRLQCTLIDLQQGITLGHPVGQWLGSLCGSASNGVMLVLAVGLALGYVKGRFALTKAMRRILTRIQGLPERAPFSKLYGPGYALLIVLMMGLGMGMRWLGVPVEIRGMVLVAVGLGLTRGGLVAMRAIIDGRGSPA